METFPWSPPVRSLLHLGDVSDLKVLRDTWRKFVAIGVEMHTRSVKVNKSTPLFLITNEGSCMSLVFLETWRVALRHNGNRRVSSILNTKYSKKTKSSFLQLIQYEFYLLAQRSFAQQPVLVFSVYDKKLDLSYLAQVGAKSSNWTDRRRRYGVKMAWKRIDLEISRHKKLTA